MLKVSLYRHAKSDWPTGGLSDHDRPLAKRGRKASKLMGRYLRDQGLIPDLVLCSTSLRTTQTHEITFANLSTPPPTVFTRDLFHASEYELIDAIKACETIAAQSGAAKASLIIPTIAHLMLIAHNPGIQDLASDLAGKGDRAALSAINIKYPTAALAVFTFDLAAWPEVEPGKGTLERYVKPRDMEK